MERGVDEKADEVAKVAVTDTRAHPGAVMIVHLNAEATIRTVVGSRRSDDLARPAVRELLFIACRLNNELEVS